MAYNQLIVIARKNIRTLEYYVLCVYDEELCDNVKINGELNLLCQKDSNMSIEQPYSYSYSQIQVYTAVARCTYTKKMVKLVRNPSRIITYSI